MTPHTSEDRNCLYFNTKHFVLHHQQLDLPAFCEICFCGNSGTADWRLCVVQLEVRVRRLAEEKED